MKRLCAMMMCAAMLLLTGCGFVFLPDTPSELPPDFKPAERFEITDPDGKVLLTQNDLERADASVQSSGDGKEDIVVVVLTFNKDGAAKFADATTRYIGQELAIRLDEEEILRPVVNAPITDGVVVISYEELDTYEEAATLAARINSTIP